MSDKDLSLFHMKQIESELDNLFSEFIDLEDLKKKKKNQQQEAFKSRALAAYSLCILADVSPKVAADAVVDGFDDNGIDAFLFSKTQNTLYLVQAKYMRNGSGSPKANDMKSFKDGVFDLLNFEYKHDRFNYKFELKEDEIKSAIRSTGLKIKIVIAYTGGKLSAHSRNTLDDLTKSLNDGQEIADIEDFNLDAIRLAISNRYQQTKINVDFKLYDWGRIDDPHQAFYGRIYAGEIVDWWLQYRNQLFDKNIRDFIGNSSVNEDITNTVETEPELFWYFNNGITALCDTITKAGATPDRKDGTFSAKGISIVNGAQTIGSIGYLYQNGSLEVREKIKFITIQIRLISITSTISDLGSKITRATNTQNRVESRDFVALNSEQERLGKEFRVIGRYYHYKRTAEAIHRDDENYELEEATVALACSNKDVKLTILAKQEISKLWSNPSREPYITLFNSSVNSNNLMRRIEVKRKVEGVIKNIADHDLSKTEFALLNYGNLFVLYLVFYRSDSNIFKMITSEKDFASYMDSTVPDMTKTAIDCIVKYMMDNYNPDEKIWTLKAWNLFRSPNNLNKLRELYLRNIEEKISV